MLTVSLAGAFIGKITYRHGRYDGHYIKQAVQHAYLHAVHASQLKIQAKIRDKQRLRHPVKYKKQKIWDAAQQPDACGLFQTSSTPIPFSRKADTYFSSSSLPVMTISNFSSGATCMNA